VAIAAAAVLFLSATSVRANIVEFTLDKDLSYLTQSAKLVGPALGGSKTSVAQVADTFATTVAINGFGYHEASDKTHYFGNMYADIQPTTIQMLPGSSMSAIYTGFYVPHDPVITDPVSPPGNTGVEMGNYGFSIAAIGLFAMQYGLVLDHGNPSNGFPTTPMPLAGNNFNLAGQAIEFELGRQAFISGLGNDTGSLIDDLFIIMGTAGADIGTWDATPGFETLTIPVHSSWSFRVTNDFGGIDQFVQVTGQLVAHPKIPEPTSLTLFGFGVVGLLSYAWRARKRRALVA
jgi:hypothetical protein